MRFPIVIYAVILSGLLSGCGLIPKKVELFQKKVKPVPVLSPKGEELRRQAAERAKETAQQTYIAAITESASTNVVAPAKETARLTDAVSESLGPPSKPSADSSAELILSLQKQIARLNDKIDSYRESTEKLEGKKIEGTGLIQVPYFLYAGGFVLVIFVGWHLAKTALTVASAANPGAAVGVGAMNVAGSLAGKGFNQVVEGGKEFLKWVGEKVDDPALKTKITDAFIAAHKQSQDDDVQMVVKTLTK